jgi:hypothetical protein
MKFTIALLCTTLVGCISLNRQKTISYFDWLQDAPNSSFKTFPKKYAGYYITNESAKKFAGNWIAPYKDGYLVFSLVFIEKYHIEGEGWDMFFDVMNGYSEVSAEGQKPVIVYTDSTRDNAGSSKKPDFIGSSRDELTLSFEAGELVFDPAKPGSAYLQVQKA